MEVLQERLRLPGGITRQRAKEIKTFTERTWLTIVPRRPTIIRRQMTSERTTKSHDSLNNAQKPARSSAVCCSARSAITPDARAFACSAADERMSVSSSWSAVMSTGALGDLPECESA